MFNEKVMNNLAPRITSENAAEFGRRSGESKRLTKRIQQEAEKLAFGNGKRHGGLELARRDVEREIAQILKWMRKETDRKERMELGKYLDNLWKKVYPDFGTQKPGKPSRQSIAPEPIPAPAEEQTNNGLTT